VAGADLRTGGPASYTHTASKDGRSAVTAMVGRAIETLETSPASEELAELVPLEAMAGASVVSEHGVGPVLCSRYGPRSDPRLA